MKERNLTKQQTGMPSWFWKGNKPKRGKRVWTERFLGSVFLLAVLCLGLTGCAPKTELADCFSEEELIEASKENITLAESGDYEAFLEKLDPVAQEALTEEVYEQYLNTVASMGAFREFGESAVVGQTDEETGENYAGVILIAKYEEGNLQYTLGYTEAMKLLQFMVK